MACLNAWFRSLFPNRGWDGSAERRNRQICWNKVRYLRKEWRGNWYLINGRGGSRGHFNAWPKTASGGFQKEKKTSQMNIFGNNTKNRIYRKEETEGWQDVYRRSKGISKCKAARGDGQSLNLHAKSCYRIPCHKPDSRKRSDAEGKVTQLIPRFTPVAMGKLREKD